LAWLEMEWMGLYAKELGTCLRLVSNHQFFVTEGNAASTMFQAADDSASLSTTAAGVSWEGATGSFPAKARMVAIM